jgi:hypothetical protein
MRRPGDQRDGLRNPSSLQGNERPMRGRVHLQFKRRRWLLMRRPGDHWHGLRNPSHLQGNERPMRGQVLIGYREPSGPFAGARGYNAARPISSMALTSG